MNLLEPKVAGETGENDIIKKKFCGYSIHYLLLIEIFYVFYATSYILRRFIICYYCSECVPMNLEHPGKLNYPEPEDFVKCVLILGTLRDSWAYTSMANSYLLAHCYPCLSRTTQFNFSSLKDMIKTTNITPPLIRKVTPPTELYKNPPKVSPMILAKPPKLPATPCTAP
jgi:hypothetical protein